MTGWIAGWAAVLFLAGIASTAAGDGTRGAIFVAAGAIVAALGRRP